MKLFYVTSILLAVIFSVNACPASDRAALMAFKASLHEPYLGIFNSWNGTNCCNNWYGISCDSITHRVADINLRGESEDPIFQKAHKTGYMTGSISPAICKLERLSSITIADWKGISGVIPSCIAKLPFLRILDLIGNKLTGPLPFDIGRLHRLTVLNVADNQITGGFPTTFTNLSSRETLTIPYLPKDCITNILVRLPIEYLPPLRFICKSWYKTINSPTFIDAHFRSSKVVLIFLTIVGQDISLPSKQTSNLFPVESKLLQPNCPFGFRKSMFDPLLLYSMKFIEITSQKGIVKEYDSACLGKIRASCNGLILIDNKIKKGGLIVMNPVTLEATDLPVGTLFPSGNESYAFTFCSRANDYKVVHLFQDNLRYVDCEVLDLSTRRWRMVDGPPFDFFNWLGCQPVFANQALYWLPRVPVNDYLVAFSLDDEKFLKQPLPKPCSSHDRIFEMAGQLGLVTHEESSQIVLWALSSSCTGGWKKQYHITVDARHVIPLYINEETCEFIFTDEFGYLYSYDLCLHDAKKINVENGSSAVHGGYVPHVNSLLSWKARPKGQCGDN